MSKESQNLKDAFKAFEKLAQTEAKEARALRKQATGLLTPELIRDHISKNQSVVLAYGKTGTVTYSPDQLRKFLKAAESRAERFDQDVQGVPYSQLVRASRPEDKQRAKTVRAAALYQRKGNILFFRVTGNSKPYYRVQIRLEGWSKAVTSSKPALVLAKELTSGRLSFECPCGRHQFWYRYLATMGNFAIEPLERDFPKIRNPRLTGCCCKHTLRVLQELKSSRFLLLLAKELDKEREKPGFKSSTRKSQLSREGLQIATGKRLSRSAAEAFKRYKAQVDKLKEEMEPRGKLMEKAMVDTVRSILKSARAANVPADIMLGGVAQTYGVSRERIDEIIREYEL